MFFCGRTCIFLWILYGNIVDFPFIVSLYVSDLPNVTISTECHISSLCVRYNFHYAVSCTRFPAVRYCTNMGQSGQTVRCCCRPVFNLFFAHLVRFGTVVLSWICIVIGIQFRFSVEI